MQLCQLTILIPQTPFSETSTGLTLERKSDYYPTLPVVVLWNTISSLSLMTSCFELYWLGI